jgi:hypothetical protein
MTLLAAIAYQPNLLEQAFSPLTNRVLALAHHGHGTPIGRAAAAVIGAITPLAFYLALSGPEIWTAMHACVGRPALY